MELPKLYFSILKLKRAILVLKDFWMSNIITCSNAEKVINFSLWKAAEIWKLKLNEGQWEGIEKGV